MSQDLHELETKLHALRPAAPGNELAARLADIARPAPAADPALEAALRALRPAAFGTDLTESVLRRTTGSQPAVIPFHKPARSWNRYMLPVAAAVALLGAAAALLVPTSANRGGNTVANNPEPEHPPIPTAIPRENGNPALVPASFGTDLAQAKDEGILWQGPNQARRVVKVTYRDRGTYVTPDGRKVEVEIPRVEYILVPEKLD